MKKLWDEYQEVGKFTYRWWGWDRYANHAARTTEASVWAHTVAFYDKGTSVLYVKQWASCASEVEWQDFPRYTETFEVLGQSVDEYKTQVYRRIIALHDGWEATVAASIPAPDTRTDEQVRADAEREASQ